MNVLSQCFFTLLPNHKTCSHMHASLYWACLSSLIKIIFVHAASQIILVVLLFSNFTVEFCNRSVCKAFASTWTEKQVAGSQPKVQCFINQFTPTSFLCSVNKCLHCSHLLTNLCCNNKTIIIFLMGLFCFNVEFTASSSVISTALNRFTV